MSSDLSGKVVLVAGGTGGLGRAVSLAFLERGARDSRRVDSCLRQRVAPRPVAMKRPGVRLPALLSGGLN